MSENPVAQLREIQADREARDAVLRFYAAAHDYWSEKDQINAHYLALNLIDEEVAQRDHARAMLCLRAYRLELDNPKPSGG